MFGISFLIALSFVSDAAFSQVTVTGPTCVIPAMTYEYSIAVSGNWNSITTMKVCVTGGVIKSRDTSLVTCTRNGGAPLASVLIAWTGSALNSFLSVTSDQGNTSLAISLTSVLFPGNISSSSKTQVIDYNSIPSMIICSIDKGGSCAPSYSDQWQQSPDELKWSDIDRATNQNLMVTASLIQQTFYRRKVTEKQSGTIGYSDVASVDIRPAPVGTHSYMRTTQFEEYVLVYCTKRDPNIKTF